MDESELELAQLATVRSAVVAWNEKYRNEKADLVNQLARLDTAPAPVIVGLVSDLVVYTM